MSLLVFYRRLRQTTVPLLVFGKQWQHDLDSFHLTRFVEASWNLAKCQAACSRLLFFHLLCASMLFSSSSYSSSSSSLQLSKVVCLWPATVAGPLDLSSPPMAMGRPLLVTCSRSRDNGSHPPPIPLSRLHSSPSGGCQKSCFVFG